MAPKTTPFLLTTAVKPSTTTTNSSWHNLKKITTIIIAILLLKTQHILAQDVSSALLHQYNDNENSIYHDDDRDIINSPTNIRSMKMPEVFTCPAEGLYAHNYECQLYYRCETQTNGYIKAYLLNCKKGTIFSRDLKLCMPAMLANREECQQYINEIDTLASDEDIDVGASTAVEGEAGKRQGIYFGGYGGSGNTINSSVGDYGYSVDSRLMHVLNTARVKGGIANNGNAMDSTYNHWQNYGLTGLSGVSVISFSTTSARSAGMSSADNDHGPACEDDGFMSDPDDCTIFYRCILNGHTFNKISFRCSEGTAWDESLQSCNHMLNVRTNGGCQSKQDIQMDEYNSQQTSAPLSQTNSKNSTSSTSTTSTQQSATSSSSTNFTSSSSSTQQSINQSSSAESSSSSSSSEQSSSSSSLGHESSTEVSSSQSSQNSNNNQNSSINNSSHPYSNSSSNQQNSISSTNNVSSSSSNQQNLNSNSQNSNTQNQNNQEINESSQNGSQNNSNQQQISSNLVILNSTSDQPSATECVDDSSYLPDKKNCAKFYRCRGDGNGGLEIVPFTCGPGTVWNQENKVCELPTDSQREECNQKQQQKPEISTSSSANNQTQSSNNSNIQTGASSNSNQSISSNQISESSSSSNQSTTSNNESESTSTNNNNQSATSDTNSQSSSSNDQSGSTSNNNQSNTSNSQSEESINNNQSSASSNINNNSSTINNQSGSSTSQSNNQSGSTSTGVNQSSSSNSQSVSANQTQNSNEEQHQSKPQKPLNPDGNCQDSETYLQDKFDCTRFYRCVDHGNGGFNTIAFDCAPGTVWDPNSKGCNHPTNVQKEKCRVMASNTSSSSSNAQSQQSSSSSHNQNNQGSSTSTELSQSSSSNQQESSISSESNQSSSSSNNNNNNQSSSHNEVTGSISNESSQQSSTTSTESNQTSAVSNNQNQGSNNQSSSSTTSSTSNNNNNNQGSQTSSQQDSSTTSESNQSSSNQSSTSSTSSSSSNHSSSSNQSSSSSQSEVTESNQSATSNNNQSSSSSSSNNQVSSSTTQKPFKPATHCESEETFLDDKEDCNKFYRCIDNGKGGYNKVSFKCPPDTVWNPSANSCDHPAQVQNLNCKMISIIGQHSNSSNNQSHSTSSNNNQQSSSSSSNNQSSNSGNQTSSQNSSSSNNQSSTESSTAQESSTSQSTAQESESNSSQSNSTSQSETTSQSSSQSESASQQSSGQISGSSLSQQNPVGTCKSNNQYLEDSKDCAKFYRCVKNTNGVYDKVAFTCGPGTVWDSQIEGCNHAWAVKNKKCGTISNSSPSSSAQAGTPPTTQQTSSSALTTSKPLEQKPTSSTTTLKPITSRPTVSKPMSTVKPTIAETISTKPPVHGICKTEGFAGDPSDCSRFYRCVDNGNGGFTQYSFRCGKGTIWDSSLQTCNHDLNKCNMSTAVEKPLIENVQQTTTSGLPTQMPQTTTSSKPGYQPSTQQPQDITTKVPQELTTGKPGQESTSQTTEAITTSKPVYQSTTPTQQTITTTKPGYQPTTDSSNATTIGKIPDTTSKPITTTTKPNINDPISSDDKCTREGFFGDKTDCLKFYRCIDNGKESFQKHEFKCGNNTVWDAYIESCNHPTDVADSRCRTNTASNMPTTTTAKYETSTSISHDNITTTIQPTSTSPIPNLPPGTICHKEGLMADPDNCRKFYRCVKSDKGYSKHEFMCAKGTGWNEDIQTCDHRDNIERCQGQTEEPKPETTTIEYTTAEPTTTTGFDKPNTTTEYVKPTSATTSYETTTLTTQKPITTTQSTSTTNEANTTDYTTTLQPATSTTPVPNLPPGKRCNGEGFMADPDNCRKFYRCEKNGKDFAKHEFMCAEGTGWSEEKQTCDHSDNIDRCQSPTKEPEKETSTIEYTSDKPTTTTEFNKPSTNYETTTTTSHKPTSIMSSTKPTTELLTTSTNMPFTSTGDTTTMQTTSTTPVPNLPPGKKCPAEGFMADPDNCRKFYRCVKKGDKIEQHDFMCGKGTGWSEDKQTCDYIVNIERCNDQTEEMPTTTIGYETTTNTTTISTESTTDAMTAPTTIEQPTNKPGYVPTTTEFSTTTNNPTTTTQPSPTTDTTTLSSTTTDKPGYEPITANETSTMSSLTTEGFESTTMEPINHNCSSEGFFPDTGDCNRYYRCVDADKNNNYQIYSFRCPKGTVWDTSLKTCNYADKVSGNCSSGATTIEYPSTTEISSTSKPKPTTTESAKEPITTTKPEASTTENSKETTTTENPKETTTMATTVPTTTENFKDTTTIGTPETTTEAPKETTNAENPETTTTENSKETTTEKPVPTTTDSSKDTTNIVEIESTSTNNPQDTTTATVQPIENTSTGKPQETTTEESENSTTTKPETTTLEVITGETSIQPETNNNTSAPCPPTSEGQNLYICPTGFRRHPKHCNMFYQCTEKADSYDQSIVVFKCSSGTIYHEDLNRCDEPMFNGECEARKLTQISVYEEEYKHSHMIQIRSTSSLCPNEGHFSLNNDECAQVFVKCQFAPQTQRLEGQIFRCPKGYTYWSVSRRCERTQKLQNCTTTKYDVSSSIPVELINIGNRRRNLKI